MIGHRDKASKIKTFIQEYRAEIKFVLIFSIGLVIAFLLVNNRLVANHVIKPITVAETYVASLALNYVFDFPNQQRGTNISGKKGSYFRMEVRNNCNGIYESIVFLMAFIAIQIPWRRKAGWMSVGFLLFHIINELRLVTLFIVGSKYPDSFVFFHETFWNYALVILTLGIFIFCAYQVSKAPEDGGSQKPRLTEAEAK